MAPPSSPPKLQCRKSATKDGRPDATLAILDDELMLLVLTQQLSGLDLARLRCVSRQFQQSQFLPALPVRAATMLLERLAGVATAIRRVGEDSVHTLHRHERVVGAFNQGWSLFRPPDRQSYDWPAAVKSFKSAADAGHADAQYYVGRLMLLGWGTREDRREGRAQTEKSAAQGHILARAMCAMHDWVTIEEEEDWDAFGAVKLYKQAAAQGQPEAQTSLAHCYMDGDWVEKDHVEGLKLLRLAAAQGEALAQIGKPSTCG